MPFDGEQENWWVKVGEKTYGPYTPERMARFIAEGRVVAASLVSRSREGGWQPARECRALQAALNDARPAFRAEHPAADEAPVANLLVWADIVSGAGRRFEYELRRLGMAAEASPGLWIVRSRHTAGVFRNALSQMLERGDKLLVIDATRDRLAWFDLGPKSEVLIREVWNAELAEVYD